MSASLAIPALGPLGYLVTPGLLALGAGLAAIPILIHFLNRRRVRRVRWAAMNWLLAALRRHQRRLRMENWLILALRVAAVVLLGLAMARWVIRDSPLGGVLGGKRSVFLVIDNSYSTEAKLDARSVFESVRYEADLVLKSIGTDDSTTVLVTNDPDLDATNGLSPHVLVGRTVGPEGAGRARETIAALRTRHAAANWALTLERLQEQMADEDTNRHVIIVTDLQAKDWLRPPRETLAAATGGGPGAGAADEGGTRIKRRLEDILRRPARVRIIDVGGRDRRDLAVTAIENRTGRTGQDVFVGRPLRLAVTVANYGGAPVSGAQLEVTVDGAERKRTYRVPDLPAASTNLRVPAPALETVEVDLPKSTFVTPGSHTVRVVVTPPRVDPGADTLNLSSVRYLALTVRRRVHVLAWCATSRSEQMTDAEQYLRGVYEGIAPSEESGPGDGGLPPIYAFRSAHTEQSLLSLLRGRAREPVDLVVLANVVPRNERLVKLLREFVREGGGLLVFTGERIKDPDALNTVFHTDSLADRLLPYPFRQAETRSRSDAEDGQGPFRFDLGFQSDPHVLAEPFTNVEAEEWVKKYPPAVWGRMPFAEPIAPPVPDPDEGGSAGAEDVLEAKVILRFVPEPGQEKGPPAIVTSRLGEGRTVWVGTSIDNGWMATSVLFVPVFLHDAAMYLTRPADAGHNLEVGGVLRAAVPAEAETVRVNPPDGGQVSPTRLTDPASEAERVLYRYADVGRAGIWTLTYDVPAAAGVSGESTKVVDAYAVNPDAREGSLVSASYEAVTDGIPATLDFGFIDSYSAASTELEDAREGEVTRWVLYAVLALLLLESFLALRFGRRRGADDAGASPAA